MAIGRKLQRLFFEGAVSLGIAFTAVAARADDGAACIVDSVTAPPTDPFDEAVSALEAFRKDREGDAATALEGARLRLAVAESVTLKHVQEGRITLDERGALLSDAEKRIARTGKAAPREAVDALKRRLKEAEEEGHLLRARYNLHLIEGMYPPQPDIINAQTSGRLEKLAQEARDAVAAIKEKTPRKTEGAGVLARLKKSLPEAHFAVAAVAVTYLADGSLGYGQSLDALCADRSVAEMESRARMLADVVRDNMKKASSGYIAFGFVPQDLPNDSTDAAVEAAARRGFEKMVSGLIVDIRGLRGCRVPSSPGSGSPSGPS